MEPTLPVVYIEDDAESREVMQVLLVEMLGMNHVTILPDSSDFIENVTAISPTPQLFMLDIHMQPIDGFAMLKQLREHSAFKQTPAVALTASVMSEEIAQLREAGFDGVIAKPIDLDTFSNQLNHILTNGSGWDTLK